MSTTPSDRADHLQWAKDWNDSLAVIHQAGGSEGSIEDRMRVVSLTLLDIAESLRSIADSQAASQSRASRPATKANSLNRSDIERFESTTCSRWEPPLLTHPPHHMIPDGVTPHAAVIKVSRLHRYRYMGEECSERDVTIRCPYCGKKHRHGWRGEDPHPGYRFSHCVPSRSYFIPAPEAHATPAAEPFRGSA